MGPLVFDKPRLMRWDGHAITDHNRAAVDVSVEKIERKQRMANGTMRKYVVAEKRTFSTSWEMLPKPTNKTVDGFYGGQAIEDFYNNTPGEFELEITDADGHVSTFVVMFSEFSKNLVKRGAYDFWNVSVTMEEV